MEHRWGQRIDFAIPLRILVGSAQAVQGELRNVSISGAFVRTTHALPSGLPIQVELPRGNAHVAPTLHICAHVTRQGKDGVGLEWTEFAAPSVRALFDLARAHQTSAPLANRIAAMPQRARSSESTTTDTQAPNADRRFTPSHHTLERYLPKHR